MPIKDKLYTVRSDVPAITHLDYTARLQTVHRETTTPVLEAPGSLQGADGIRRHRQHELQRSGEPIVCTPRPPTAALMRTDMDVLVVNRFVFRKENQPPWQEERNWRQDLVLD